MKLVALSLVLFIFAGAQAFRGRPSVEITEYSWNRTVDGTDVAETGASIDSGPRIFIKSADRALSGLGFSPTKTIIDFSTDPSVTAVRIGKNCYLLSRDDGLTYDAAKAELESRNDTTVTTALTDSLLNATKATATRLSFNDKYVLFNSNPAVAKICGYFTPIYRPIEADAGSFPAAGAEDDYEKVVSGITYDLALQVLTSIRRYHGYFPRFHYYG